MTETLRKSNLPVTHEHTSRTFFSGTILHEPVSIVRGEETIVATTLGLELSSKKITLIPLKFKGDLTASAKQLQVGENLTVVGDFHIKELLNKAGQIITYTNLDVVSARTSNGIITKEPSST